MATPNEKPQIGLSREDLIAILAEARKPVKSEKEVREEKQAEAERKNMMETLKADAERREREKKNCSHMRNNGTTTTVYIQNLDRLYCQVCTKWIFPDQEPELFNKHAQLLG